MDLYSSPVYGSCLLDRTVWSQLVSVRTRSITASVDWVLRLLPAQGIMVFCWPTRVIPTPFGGLTPDICHLILGHRLLVFVLHCSIEVCVYHHVTGECQRFMSHAICKVNGMEINTRHCLYTHISYRSQIASVCARYKTQTITVCCLRVSEGSRGDTTHSCSIHFYTIPFMHMHAHIFWCSSCQYC